jgi:hypothetical protein
MKPPKKPRKPRALKPGEALFAAESIKPGLSKVEAARRAGLDYVPQGAHVVRYRDELLQKQLVMADITVERIVLELGRIAFSDPGRMFDARGNMIPVEEMDEDTRRAISGFDVERRTEGHGEDAEVYYTLKPRFWNKNQALDTLAKLHYDEAGKLRMPTGPGGSAQLAPDRPVLHVHFVAPPQLTHGSSSAND